MARRNSRGSYLKAAKEVLEDIGGGPIRSRDLVEEVVKRGLLEPTQFTYFNLLKRVRESAQFDTSKRGFVSLSGAAEKPDVPGASSPEEPVIAQESPAEFEDEQEELAVTADNA